MIVNDLLCLNFENYQDLGKKHQCVFKLQVYYFTT